MENLTWLTFAVGTLIPLAVALVTKLETSSKVKSLVNVVLSALAVVGLRAIDNNGVFNEASLIEGFVIFTTGIAAYYGVHKPQNVSGTIAVKTASVGI